MTKLTIAVDEQTRSLIAKHAGARGVGRLFTQLIHEHDRELQFGGRRVEDHLRRIEKRIIELQDRDAHQEANTAY